MYTFAMPTRNARKRHGTVWMYQYGYPVGAARCAKCRAAWAAYIRDRRREKSESLPPRSATQAAKEIARAEETLSRLYASGEDEDVPLRVKLSPFGLQILTALMRAETTPSSEVFEKLLRLHGPEILADTA